MTSVAVTEQPTECAIEEPFGALINRMRPEILAFSRRRIGADRADEILSDVLFAAMRATRSGTELSPAWLMAVTRNKVIDNWRRTERQKRLIEKIRTECSMFSADNGLEISTLSDVASTLEKLSPHHRSFLVRHYVHGVPLADLAADAGMSYAAAESAMARARRAFRRHHVAESARFESAD